LLNISIRDDRIVFFHYLILSCFWKVIFRFRFLVWLKS